MSQNSRQASRGSVSDRARFLAEMNHEVPWARLVAMVTPYYPKPREGRECIPLERMLRIYLVQQWFGLSDDAVEQSLYNSDTLSSFVGADRITEVIPDPATIRKFRHLLKRRALADRLIDEAARTRVKSALLASLRHVIRLP